MSSRYQRSECKGGFLHKFVQVKQTTTGYVERCERCGVQVHFPVDTPNHIYIQYHIRSILRASDPRFKKEYPEIKV